MLTFNHLGLSKQVLKALSELGFEKPSEIQEQSIPILLEAKHDFIGLAQTGTGKTAAFGLPLLEHMDANLPHTQALILAPTRELGQQIAQQLELYGKYKDKLNMLAVYGGAAITNQMQALRKPQHIIIATPGRLIDLIGRKAIKLDQLEYLVLDEADEMLNMGFKEELDKILEYTPQDKLTWLFSATMPPEIRNIVKKYMLDPAEVKVNTKNEVNVNIEHVFTQVNYSHKAEALKRFLDVNPDMRGVVFCRTKRDTQNLAEELLKKDYKADALHGDLSQPQRDRVMKRFKSHELQVLIATDVAARGIDVNDLTHVFHYSLPDDASYYTHRSGRTARAGKKGISVVFVSSRERGRIGRLEKQLGISFAKVHVPSVQDIAEVRVRNWTAEVLQQKTKGRIEQALVDEVSIMFGGLSKEELIAKLLVMELDKLKFDSGHDLNEKNDHKPYPQKNKRFKDRGRRASSHKKRHDQLASSDRRKPKKKKRKKQ